MADGELQLHFPLTLRIAGREGTIWKEKVRSLKNIYHNKLPGLDRLWAWGEGEERGSGGVVTEGGYVHRPSSGKEPELQGQLHLSCLLGSAAEGA